VSLEQTVANTGVAGKDELEERAEPNRAIGGEIEDAEEVDLADLIQHTGQSGYRKPEAGLGADKKGFDPGQQQASLLSSPGCPGHPD
jgi:hypothetical protein